MKSAEVIALEAEVSKLQARLVQLDATMLGDPSTPVFARNAQLEIFVARVQRLVDEAVVHRRSEWVASLKLALIEVEARRYERCREAGCVRPKDHEKGCFDGLGRPVFGKPQVRGHAKYAENERIGWALWRKLFPDRLTHQPEPKKLEQWTRVFKAIELRIPPEGV